jgi:CubicO group peptidase (beta-lactamase class C family)
MIAVGRIARPLPTPRKHASMMTTIPISTQGWLPLRQLVDPLVAKHLETTKPKLPGLSVAVSWRGRLLLAGGYGFADLENQVPMTRRHRGLIGSVTKAAITGPTVWKVLHLPDIAIAPETKLYGPSGVLGTRFDRAIELGVRRFTPIVAIATDAQDRTHAWYSDGTMSIGTRTDFDHCHAPVSYSLPANKTPMDIRSIAFDENGRVYSWYDDGTYAIGTPTQLGAGESLAKVSLPNGRSMLEVVGIGIAKSTNQVHVFYEDGKMSRGTPTDFGAHLPEGSYSPGQGREPYEIRDLDIGEDGRICMWFWNGTGSLGTTNFVYTWPDRPDGPNWMAWYHAITLQDLFNHSSGFARDESGTRAEKMLKPKGPLTYATAHEHFLLTQKLRFEPGTRTEYSNHGFGSFTLVVERLSGIAFRDYVKATYLAPLGLADEVIPHPGHATAQDARDYGHDEDGTLARLDIPPERLGAAGGYRSSAENLLAITAHLRREYSDADIDRMGWMNKGGVLSHNGAREGGRCQVSMFPPGHRMDDVDVGEVHVALVANALDYVKKEGKVLADEDDELAQLVLEIAKTVASAEVPPVYDLWLLDLEC